MKFIHLGDSHIGNVYKSEQRNEDIKDMFKQLVDAAIGQSVDFIVHSGDLFNEGNPQLSALLFATDQLNRLRQNGIRLFIVPGSHDVGMGEEDSIIELFDRNGLLTNLNSKRYIEKKDDSFVLKGGSYKNAFICGIGGKRSRVEEEIFKKLKVTGIKNEWIKIFVFHHTISDLGEKFKDLDKESLPAEFDYYAAGHWHGHRGGIVYGKGLVQYPGSLEYCDEKEIVDNPNRGYYLIDYGEKGINSIEYKLLKTRGKDIIVINADSKKAQDIESEAISKLSDNDGKLLVIKFEGKLDGRRADLDVSKIKKAAKDAGYSYSSVNISKLYDKEDQHIEIKSKDLDSIEKEFLDKKGYEEHEIKIAQMIISAAEAGSSPEEIRVEVEKIFDKYDNK